MSSYFRIENFDLDIAFHFVKDSQTSEKKVEESNKGGTFLGKHKNFQVEDLALLESIPLMGEDQPSRDELRDFPLHADSQWFVFQLGLKKDLRESLKEFKNQSIWKVPLSQVEKRLKENRWVNKVFVRRAFPNGISIKVQIFSPLLAYVGKDGTLSYVTKEGSFIFHDVIWDVPILRGKIFLSKKHLLQKVIQLIQSLPEEGVFSRSKISDISYKKNKGLILYLTDSKVKVLLGMRAFSNKYHRIEYVLKYLNLKGFQARVIDARFSKKIVVSLENQA